MKKLFLRLPAALALASLLSSCALVNVKIHHLPTLPAKRTVESLAPTSQPAAILLQVQDKSMPDSRKLELLLEAIRESSKPGASQQEINHIATARFVEILAAGHFQNCPIPITPSSRETLDPREATQIIIARSIEIKGLRERVTVPGVGVPCVAWFQKGAPALAAQPSHPRYGMSIPVTALIRFEKRGPQLTFYRRLHTEKVTVRGRRELLAGDFSAPLAYLLSKGKNSSIDVQALIFSDTNFEQIGLIQIDEYDPRKIPVVFVHGLLCRPEAWTPAVNQLLADPEIRSRYQFWFYLYPTGLPVWWSAAKLRAELDRYRTTVDPSHKNPNLDRIVLVGHSMGGLISSLLVRKGGKDLWAQFTDTPPEKMNISASAKEHLLKVVNFEPRQDISRVVFMATPHQGSQLAMNPLAGFFSALVRLPKIVSSYDRHVMVGAIRDNLRDLFAAPANSIRFLQAKSPLLLSILKLPMSKSVTYHSVIGDQGKGDTPESSDGVVPYWSSHLPNAESEKIVPSSHGVNESPEGIEELRRILQLHLKESGNP